MVFRKCHLPCRYVFAVMGFLATLVGYMMRISLDVTISHMVNGTMTSAPVLFDPYSCPNIGISVVNHTEVEPMQEVHLGPFNWDDQVQKSLSSAFTKAYIMTQFIGGMMADQNGGKKFMGAAFLVLSICTFIAPFAAKWIGSNALYVLRFISGMTLGPSIPVLMSMMSKWVPDDERAFIASIIFPGTLLGYVAGSYLGELIVSIAGWESVYYAFGLLGLAWCCLWKYLVFSDPNEHPYVSENEKRYLNDNVTSLIRSTKYDLDPMPWKAYIRCGALWGTVVAYIGKEWAFSIFTTYVPKYLREVLRLDISFLDYLKYMPYLCTWLAALFFGFTCDILIKRGYCSVKNARKLFTIIAAMGSCICILIIMYTGCSQTFAVFCMFVGMMFIAPYYSGCVLGPLDLTPNYAGSMIGVVDNIGINVVLLLPAINSLIIKDALLSQWQTSFWISIVIIVFTVAVYLYYVQAEQTWWDDVRKNGYPKNWKHGLFGCEGLIDDRGQSLYVAKKDIEIKRRKATDANDLS